MTLIYSPEDDPSYRIVKFTSTLRDTSGVLVTPFTITMIHKQSQRVQLILDPFNITVGIANSALTIDDPIPIPARPSYTGGANMEIFINVSGTIGLGRLYVSNTTGLISIQDISGLFLAGATVVYSSTGCHEYPSVV